MSGKVAIQRRNLKANDLVMTPPHLAVQIVKHFKPRGICLDPCAGEGAFEEALRNQRGVDGCRTCEISEGEDFFEFSERVDWIVSNPPYSILSAWLEHSFHVANDVVYLVQTPAPFFTKRMRIAADAGFGIREIFLVDCPQEWKQQGLSFGTGLAAVHWQFGYDGGIFLTGSPR